MEKPEKNEDLHPCISIWTIDANFMKIDASGECSCESLQIIPCVCRTQSNSKPEKYIFIFNQNLKHMDKCIDK